MRRFRLVRQTDHSGVSGTGAVVEGVKFSNDSVALRWLKAPQGYNYVPRGVAFYEGMDHVRAVHGHGGDTVVEWID